MVLLSALLTACGQAPTYHTDIQPIVQAHCVDCHSEGESAAGFSLASYDALSALGDVALDAVEAKRMPPWGASEQSLPMKYDISLHGEQVELIREWVDAGMPEGDPAEAGQAIELDKGGLDRVDFSIDMPDSYTPTAPNDEYRCFPILWPTDEAGYITGFVGQPGNLDVVHHLITYMIPPEQAEIAQGFDDAFDGPGYPCYGGPTPSEEGDYDTATLYTQLLGQWAPGLEGISLPQGTGIGVQPGSVAILQVHYNTAAGPAPDLSSLGVRWDTQVDTPGFVLPFFDLSWYAAPDTMLIPAGEQDASHGYSTTLADNYVFQRAGVAEEGGQVYSIFPHMHQLGVSISLSLQRASGEQIMLVDVPDYDFNWQREYVLEEPISVGPQDTLSIECRWDNTEANRLATGASPEPVDVGWGEGTGDEMCIATMYMTR